MDDSTSKQSLDELLDEIQRESSSYPDISSAGGTSKPRPVSAGMSNISAHLTPVTTPFPDERAGSSEVWEPSLSPRQRALPKLNIRMVAGAVALLLLTLGIGSTTYLVQQSQDLRQSAYEQTLPTLEGEPATTTVEQESSLQTLLTQQEGISQQITVVGAIIIGVSVFIFVMFFFWLFFS